MKGVAQCSKTGSSQSHTASRKEFDDRVSAHYGHVRTVEARLGEIDDQLRALKTQDVDRDDLARALEEFDPIWDALLIPERERVMQLLVEKIDYDGRTKQMATTWRLAGFGQLAAEVTP